MIVKIVLCNRCGKEVTEEHPDRISVAKQYYDEVTDGWGGRKMLSKYKVVKNIHFCTECNKAFEAFLRNE